METDPDVLMKLLFSNVTDYAIFMLDPAGFIVEWTEGAQRVTGYTAQEVLGQHLSLFYTPEEIQAGQPGGELSEAASSGRVEREGWRITKTGKRVFINEIATAIRHENGDLLGFAKISRDITARKTAEDALRHSEERLRIVLESVPDHAIMTMDENNRITSWNTGAHNLFGYTSSEMTGQPGDIIFTKEDRAAGLPQREIETALRNGYAANERYHVRKDGTKLYVSGALSPMYSSDGRLVGYVKMARDLTERRIMEQRLDTANRRKDEFIAMLGHELRNPLTPVTNTLQILKMTYGEDRSLMPLVDVMVRQIDHMVVLINDLLDVSRISRGKINLRLNRINLVDVIHEALAAIRPLLASSGRKLYTTIPDTPVYMKGDVSRLLQVFHNIFHNAVKYTAEDGRIWLHVNQQNEAVTISIRDDGIGIARENLADVFESFVQIGITIDRSQGGLGLGLSLVKQLIELHGGTVFVISDGLGEGSEFIIQIPLDR
jgi:PAS domain S-box-containing protein